jgi:hypothetical protein
MGFRLLANLPSNLNPNFSLTVDAIRFLAFREEYFQTSFYI